MDQKMPVVIRVIYDSLVLNRMTVTVQHGSGNVSCQR